MRFRFPRLRRHGGVLLVRCWDQAVSDPARTCLALTGILAIIAIMSGGAA